VSPRFPIFRTRETPRLLRPRRGVFALQFVSRAHAFVRGQRHAACATQCCVSVLLSVGRTRFMVAFTGRRWQYGRCFLICPCHDKERYGTSTHRPVRRPRASRFAGSPTQPSRRGTATRRTADLLQPRHICPPRCCDGHNTGGSRFKPLNRSGPPANHWRSAGRSGHGRTIGRSGGPRVSRPVDRLLVEPGECPRPRQTGFHRRTTERVVGHGPDLRMRPW
jgi:hypothetical protein